MKPAPNIIAISSTVCIGKKVNNKALHTVKHWMQSKGLILLTKGILNMRFSMICPLNTLMK